MIMIKILVMVVCLITAFAAGYILSDIIIDYIKDIKNDE